MQYTKLLAGVVLMASAAAASAADINHTFNVTLDGTGVFSDTFSATAKVPVLNKTFLDKFNFGIDQASELDSSLTSISTSKAYDLNITSFNLYSGNTLVAAGVKDSAGTLDAWHLSTANIGLGNYSLLVGGTVLGTKGGSFAVVTNTSPVPEPETWSMVGVSLAALGFIARRKSGRKAV